MLPADQRWHCRSQRPIARVRPDHDGLLDRGAAPVDAVVVSVRRLPGTRERLLFGQAGQDALLRQLELSCSTHEDYGRARIQLDTHEPVRDGIADVLRGQQGRELRAHASKCIVEPLMRTPTAMTAENGPR